MKLQILNRYAATAVVAGMMATPLAGLAQISHYDAKRQQENSDARHHTKAKIVGGSAVGGAVVGGLLGGPKGAAIGAGAGAGGGLLANKARKDHDIHERQRNESYDRRY
jgi:hypothetical protein